MKKINLLLLSLTIFITPNILAQPLKDAIENTLNTNPEIKSIRSNTQAYKLYIDEEYGNYLPTVSIDSYLEDKDSDNKNMDTKVTTEKNQNGYNAQVKLEQLIYDGGLTPSKIDESKYNYEANKIKNKSFIEEVIFETVEAYIQSVKFKELALLSKNNIEIHEIYLETAIESEEVSGETLDKLQVESKLLDAKSKFIKEQRDANEAYTKLVKYNGVDITSQVCRPIINSSKLGDLDNILKEALLNNYTVLEELEKIKAQRAIISQEQSKFLPTIRAKLLRELDKDLDSEDVYQKETSARISLSYNLFNGFKDIHTFSREKKFLNEAQKKLDNTVRTVTQEITTQKDTFDSTSKRIDFLKQYIETSKNILVITKEQFEGGTKTFLDVLNAEAELYRARKDLIEEEYLHLIAYYKLLNLTAVLSDTILHSDTQMCSEITVDLTLPENVKGNESEEDIEALLEEENETEINPIINENNDKKEIEKMMGSLLNEVYDGDKVDVYKKSKDNGNPKVKEKKEPIKNQDQKSIKENNNSTHLEKNLKKEFLKENPNGYTLTIATFPNNSDEINKLEKRYSFSENIIKYNVNANDKKYMKIIYGAFHSKEEALQAINSLPSAIQKNNPYVRSINYHKNKNNKYN